jgi:hypothetical protein
MGSFVWRRCMTALQAWEHHRESACRVGNRYLESGAGRQPESTREAVEAVACDRFEAQIEEYDGPRLVLYFWSASIRERKCDSGQRMEDVAMLGTVAKASA